MGDRAGAPLLAALDTLTDQARRDAARILSAASGSSSGLVTALPGAPSTRLSDADFVLARRQLLGPGTAATIANQPCPYGATDAGHSDHAMACKQTAEMALLCHHILGLCLATCHLSCRVRYQCRTKLQQLTSSGPMWLSSRLETGRRTRHLARWTDLSSGLRCHTPGCRVVLIRCVTTGWVCSRQGRD